MRSITVIMQQISEIPNSEADLAKELAETKKKLDDALKIIAESDKEKTDFLSRMSHELCTPMNAIISMAHLAAAAEDAKSMRSCVSVIFDASTQLLDVINDILDMSRIELGQVSLLHLPFELEKMIAETRDAVFGKSGAKDRVYYDIEKEVPTKLRGDEYRLSQVISNLVKTITKFASEDGRIEIKVGITEQTKNDAIFEFRIIDADNKVPIAKHQQIISTFGQPEAIEYIHYGEAGLGVTICKRIVEMMGGSIWVENIPGTEIAISFSAKIEILKNSKKKPADNDVKVESINKTADQSERRERAHAKIANTPQDGAKGLGYNKYLPYIDINEGLSNIGGNRKLFGIMLQNFKDGSAFSDLEMAVNEENMAKAQRYYSIIKNASRNLALIKLHKGLLLNESQILKVQYEENSALLSIEDLVKKTNGKINELLAEWE